VLGTPDEIRASMTAAGLRAIEVHEVTVQVGTALPADLWRSFSRGGAPAVLMRKKMGDVAFAALETKLIARLEQMLGPHPVDVRFTALFGVGTR
jgi:crotonobetainyl-CoA:carnitine CoA-transferase CaiB-like acyl-CoA transferase